MLIQGSVNGVGPHYWDPGAMHDLFGLGQEDGDAKTDSRKVWWTIYGILSPLSAAASAYHGYKRHDSIGAAIGWAVLGALFPIITPAVGLAQGFGQPK